MCAPTGLRPNFQPVRARAHHELLTPHSYLLTKTKGGVYLYQPILTLSSGTELKGGSPGSAVKSLTLHTAVNAGQEFTIGSAFSDYIEAEIWADPGGSLQITAGDALTYYRQDDAGNRTKVGVFYAEKPTRTKRNSYKVTAYDTMSKLDADFSGWLRANQAQFPKTI